MGIIPFFIENSKKRVYWPHRNVANWISQMPLAGMTRELGSNNFENVRKWYYTVMCHPGLDAAKKAALTNLLIMYYNHHYSRIMRLLFLKYKFDL